MCPFHRSLQQEEVITTNDKLFRHEMLSQDPFSRLLQKHEDPLWHQ